MKPPVVLITAERLQGTPLLVALSRSEPERGYVIDIGLDGRFVCPCKAHHWRGDCSHVRAASDRARRERQVAA